MNQTIILSAIEIDIIIKKKILTDCILRVVLTSLKRIQMPISKKHQQPKKNQASL